MQDKVEVLVIVEDDIYLDKLCDYMENTTQHFKTLRYSDKEAVNKYLQKTPNVDVIIFEERMISQEQLQLFNGIKIKLGTDSCFDESNKIYTISKYQRLDAISNEVIKICSESDEFIHCATTGDSDTQIIAFSAPQGGVGKTTITLALASILANRYGKKVLYLNLEEISSMSCFFDKPQGAGLSVILRKIIEDKPNIAMFIEGNRVTEATGRFDYLLPFNDSSDLGMLKPEHVEKLLATLKEMKSYDTILIDLEWKENILPVILKEAQKIFMIAKSNGTSQYKLNAYMEALKSQNLMLCNKVKTIINEYTSGETYLNYDFNLPYDSACVNEKMLLRNTLDDSLFVQKVMLLISEIEKG